MNILFLYAGVIDPNKGGIQRVTSVLSDYFEEKGHSVWYLSLNFYKKENPHPNRQLMFPDKRALDTDENITFWEDVLWEKNIDIVVNQAAQSPQSLKLMRIAKRKCRIYSVYHTAPLGKILNFEAAYVDRFKGCFYVFIILAKIDLFKKLLLWLYIRKYRKYFREISDVSTCFILLSNGFKSEFSLMLGRKSLENVIAISNPVSFNDLYQYDSKSKINEVLYVGRIDNSPKRVDLLLRIWQKIYKRFPEWKLTIVGDGKDLERMKTLARNLCLENYSFEGYVDPREYYMRASIFCMTSSFEGFGIVLVEAMHYGTVPLAFNSYASVKDIIHDRKDGFLVTPFDLDEYAKTLELLIVNESMRKEMALNAIESSKKFSIEFIGGKWLSLFNK